MSGVRSEQIKEALRSYGGPRDVATILLMARERQRAHQARNNRDNARKKMEMIAFSNLSRTPPQLCGLSVKIDVMCRSKKMCRSEKIIRICAERLGFTFSDLMSRRRKLPLARARQVAMWMVWKTTRRSYPEIGRIMNRDHTTIMHGVWRIDKIMAENAAFRERVEAILREVMSLSMEKLKCQTTS